MYSSADMFYSYANISNNWKAWGTTLLKWSDFYSYRESYNLHRRSSSPPWIPTFITNDNMAKCLQGKTFVVFHSTVNLFLQIIALPNSNISLYKNATVKVLPWIAIFYSKRKSFPLRMFSHIWQVVTVIHTYYDKYTLIKKLILILLTYLDRNIISHIMEERLCWRCLWI